MSLLSQNINERSFRIFLGVALSIALVPLILFILPSSDFSTETRVLACLAPILTMKLLFIFTVFADKKNFPNDLLETQRKEK